MNPVRNWLLIGLMFASVVGAWVWNQWFPLPRGFGDPGWQPDPQEVLAMGLWAIGVVSLLVGAFVCLVFWFALSNRDMNRLTGGSFPTALWTLVLFVPFVQFVAFYAMAQQIHRAQEVTGRTGLSPMVLFVFMWLLVPIGIPMAQWQMQRIDPHVPLYTQSRRPEAGFTDVAPPDNASPDVASPDVVSPGTGSSGPSISAATFSSAESLSWSTLREEHVPVGGAAVKRVSPSKAMGGTPEVVPMPASGIAACFFSVASVPLGLLGPAGLAASIMGLYARERFLDLRSREPGHRGGRVVSRLHWVAFVGMGFSLGVSFWMLVALLAT